MESENQSSSFQNYQKFEIDLEMLIGGIKVNYYFHCKTQLWLFSHFITQEQESELVILGRIIEENTFRDVKIKNIIIDQTISIDFKKGKKSLIIYDIKKSSKFQKAHYYQMLYYLWYLKNIKSIKNVFGIISYPLEKKKVKVVLNFSHEKEIIEILNQIKKITSLPTPPKPQYKKYCKKCSYFEFCWSE